MKNIFRYLFIIMLVGLTSCQSRLVSPTKPMKDNSLNLYGNYNIQTVDGKRSKVKVLRLDADNLYGKNNKGEDVVIAKKDIREVRRFDFIASIIVVAAAVAALLIIPV